MDPCLEIATMLYNLNQTEILIVEFLMKTKSKHVTIMDITNQLKLDRTTIQKAIKNLLNIGLIERSPCSCTGRKCHFIYETSKERIKKVLKKKLTEMLKEVENSK